MFIVEELHGRIWDGYAWMCVLWRRRVWNWNYPQENIVFEWKTERKNFNWQSEWSSSIILLTSQNPFGRRQLLKNKKRESQFSNFPEVKTIRSGRCDKNNKQWWWCMNSEYTDIRRKEKWILDKQSPRWILPKYMCTFTRCAVQWSPIYLREPCASR